MFYMSRKIIPGNIKRLECSNMEKKKLLQKETLGQRIKRIRIQQGYTQADVGKKVGVAQRLVSDYESGRLRVSVDMLVRFAKAFDIDVNELIIDAHNSKNKKEISPIGSKLTQRIRRIETLPISHQKTIIKTVDAFLKAAGK